VFSAAADDKDKLRSQICHGWLVNTNHILLDDCVRNVENIFILELDGFQAVIESLAG